MMMKPILRCLMFSLALMAVSLPGQAAMVGTAQMQSERAMLDLESIASQRDWIRQQLIVGGVEETAARQRVASMTDVQVAQIHQRIDQSPAGGDALVILILILVITELMGYTDIVPNWPAE